MFGLPPEAAAVRAAAGGLTEALELQIAVIAEMREVRRAVMASGGAKKHQLPPPVKMPERPKPKGQKVDKPIGQQFREAFGPPKRR